MPIFETHTFDIPTVGSEVSFPFTVPTVKGNGVPFTNPIALALESPDGLLEVPQGGTLFFRIGSVDPAVKGVSTNGENGDVVIASFRGEYPHVSPTGNISADEIAFKSGDHYISVSDNPEIGPNRSRRFKLVGYID